MLEHSCCTLQSNENCQKINEIIENLCAYNLFESIVSIDYLMGYHEPSPQISSLHLQFRVFPHFSGALIIRPFCSLLEFRPKRTIGLWFSSKIIL